MTSILFNFGLDCGYLLDRNKLNEKPNKIAESILFEVFLFLLRLLDPSRERQIMIKTLVLCNSDPDR